MVVLNDDALSGWALEGFYFSDGSAHRSGVDLSEPVMMERRGHEEGNSL
jgi:hypothetical protein